MSDRWDDVPIALDRSTGTPLSTQIAAQVLAAASTGQLHTGDRLLSSRTLATRLGVSRTVVTAAYQQLHTEGWLTSRHGSGTYLTTTPPRNTSASPTCTEVISDIDTGTEPIDLTPGAPCVETIDRAAWRRAWWSAGHRDPLTCAPAAGDPDYCAAVADNLVRHSGFDGNNTMLVATAGTGAALAELAAVLLHTGDVVAVENPGYQPAVSAFQAVGAQVLPISVDHAGLRVDLLPDTVHAVYCTPAHQFPLGARMPHAHRTHLIEFARRRGAFIIEDDTDSHLPETADLLPPLRSLAPDVVVQLGSTARILSPTLGVGWLVAPRALAAKIVSAREASAVVPPPAGQQVVAELARAGDLADHLRRMRRAMTTRRAMIVGELRRLGVKVVGDDAGSHLVVPLESAAHEQHALTAARERGLRLEGLSRHHLGTPQHFGILLGYGAPPRDRLIPAVRALASCLQSRRG